MTQFFTPANVVSTGLQRSGSGPNIILINPSDRLLLGAGTTPWTAFRIALVGDGEAGGLLLTDALQSKFATIILDGDDLLLTTSDGNFRVKAGANQVLKIQETYEVLAGGYTSVPDVGLNVGFAHKYGFFTVPTVGANSQWAALYISGGETFLRADRMVSSLPNAVLKIICDGTLVASFAAGNGDFYGNPIKNVGAGVDAGDVAIMSQVTSKAAISAVDGSGKPKIVVSDEVTSEYHAINRKYLEDTMVSRKSVVQAFNASGLIPATVEVCIIVTGIAVALTLPACEANMGRRIVVKKRLSAGVTSVLPNGTDTIDFGISYTLQAEHSYVELIAGTEDAWIVVSGNGTLNT